MTFSTLPNPGMGTFRLTGQIAFDSVTTALQAGYRHIDTAQAYKNEDQVGAAIEASGIARDDIFVTTKIWMENFSPERFLPSLKYSLSQLDMDAVDLLLIHWPLPEAKLPMSVYLGELVKAKEAGLTQHIGVSNFTTRQLQQAQDLLGDHKILTNQIEVHPFLQNQTVIEYCQQHGITVTGYMPLAVGKVLSDAVLQSIADKYSVTPAAITLAWLKQIGVIAIPSSTKKTHIDSNLNAITSDLMLDDEDMARIRKLDSNQRLADPDFAPEWD